MNKKLICLLMLVFSLGLTFTACSDDDDDLVNVALEKNEISVDQDGSATVKITNGNGGYSVKSADEAIAKATVNDNVVTITGLTAGETTLTVTDKENRKATIKVVVVGYAEQVAATYTGDLTITLAGQGVTENDRSIVLEKSTDNKAKLLLENFEYEGIALGDIVVDGIIVTKKDGEFNLEETTTELELAGGAISATVTVVGNVSAADAMELTINVVTPMVPLPIVVTFSGEKKAN